MGDACDRYRWCVGLHHTGTFPDMFRLVKLGPHCTETRTPTNNPDPPPQHRYRDVSMKHVRLASGRLASYCNTFLFLLFFLSNCNENQKRHWVFVEHDPNECSIDLTIVSVRDSVTDRFCGPESVFLMWLSRKDSNSNLMISVIWAINRGNNTVWGKQQKSSCGLLLEPEIASSYKGPSASKTSVEENIQSCPRNWSHQDQRHLFLPLYLLFQYVHLDFYYPNKTININLMWPAWCVWFGNEVEEQTQS